MTMAFLPPSCVYEDCTDPPDVCVIDRTGTVPTLWCMCWGHLAEVVKNVNERGLFPNIAQEPT
ncbi:MAG: hypothetical protein OXI12_01770 [Gammaproteobacteria bacterium]|nr:hypothetical protein [Gammaproteobacteria bacterium]